MVRLALPHAALMQHAAIAVGGVGSVALAVVQAPHHPVEQGPAVLFVAAAAIAGGAFEQG